MNNTSISQEELLNKKFLKNHDIFHLIAESEWFQGRYGYLLKELNKPYNSFSFVGEGLIELFSRFFGNCSQEIIIQKDAQYISLPVNQKGVKETQPYRVFPLKKRLGVEGYSLVQYQEQVRSCIRYTMVGSLVSGDIVDKYLELYSTTIPEKKRGRDYYRSKEFVYELQDYLLGKSRFSKETQLLNLFLKENYNCQLEDCIEAISKYLNFFYTYILEFPNSEIKIEKDRILFPVNIGIDRTVLGEIYYVQKSYL